MWLYSKHRVTVLIALDTFQSQEKDMNIFFLEYNCPFFRNHNGIFMSLNAINVLVYHHYCLSNAFNWISAGVGQTLLLKCNTGADLLCELRCCCCKAHLSDAQRCITCWSQRVSEPYASLRGSSLATSSTEMATGPSGWASQQTTPISCSLKLLSNGSHVWERQTSWAVASKVILAQKYVPSYAKISTCWARSNRDGKGALYKKMFSLYH